jgi:hypothetical protein
MASGIALAMRAMASSATGVRRVISKTEMPPSSSALAIGRACSRSLMTITGTRGEAANTSAGVTFQFCIALP